MIVESSRRFVWSSNPWRAHCDRLKPPKTHPKTWCCSARQWGQCRWRGGCRHRRGGVGRCKKYTRKFSQLCMCCNFKLYFSVHYISFILKCTTPLAQTDIYFVTFDTCYPSFCSHWVTHTIKIIAPLLLADTVCHTSHSLLLLVQLSKLVELNKWVADYKNKSKHNRKSFLN